MTELQRQTRQLLNDIFEGAFSEDVWNFKKTEFARRAKMSTSAIYKLRVGTTKEPRYTTILRLCKVVGIPTRLASQQLTVKNNVGKKKHQSVRRTKLKLVS